MAKKKPPKEFTESITEVAKRCGSTVAWSKTRSFYLAEITAEIMREVVRRSPTVTHLQDLTWFINTLSKDMKKRYSNQERISVSLFSLADDLYAILSELTWLETMWYKNANSSLEWLVANVCYGLYTLDRTPDISFLRKYFQKGTSWAN